MGSGNKSGKSHPGGNCCKFYNSSNWEKNAQIQLLQILQQLNLLKFKNNYKATYKNCLQARFTGCKLQESCSFQPFTDNSPAPSARTP